MKRGAWVFFVHAFIRACTWKWCVCIIIRVSTPIWYNTHLVYTCTTLMHTPIIWNTCDSIYTHEFYKLPAAVWNPRLWFIHTQRFTNGPMFTNTKNLNFMVIRNEYWSSRFMERPTGQNMSSYTKNMFRMQTLRWVKKKGRKGVCAVALEYAQVTSRVFKVRTVVFEYVPRISGTRHGLRCIRVRINV